MAAVAGARAATATLVAATVDTVTLSGMASQLVELVNHGTDAIYYRTDGTDPVSAADECYVVLGGERVTLGLPATGIIKVISAGTPTYTVQALG